LEKQEMLSQPAWSCFSGPSMRAAFPLVGLLVTGLFSFFCIGISSNTKNLSLGIKNLSQAVAASRVFYMSKV
jgi:hypothetical protein